MIPTMTTCNISSCANARVAPLVLMKADGPNAACLRRVLDDYCASSGQLVSDAKSSIFFSSNTPVQEKVVVFQNLNIDTEALNDKYLGLPTMVGIDRSDSFSRLHKCDSIAKNCMHVEKT